MKIQNFGCVVGSAWVYGGYERDVWVMGLAFDWLGMCGPAGDYKNKRLNGDEKNDAPPTALPCDGMITWVKGRVEGEHVYGVKNSLGGYDYECRYDEGQRDRRWMEECDRNYLARLHLRGAKTDQERQDLAENRDRAARAAEEVAKLPEEQLSKWLKASEELRKFKATLQLQNAADSLASEEAKIIGVVDSEGQSLFLKASTNDMQPTQTIFATISEENSRTSTASEAYSKVSLAGSSASLWTSGSISAAAAVVLGSSSSLAKTPNCN